MDTENLSFLNRLHRTYASGINLLNKPKFFKQEAVFWLNKVSQVLKDFYGDTAPILIAIRKKISIIMKNGITHEQFESELNSLKGLINQIEYLARVEVLNPYSTPSLPPAGRNVFVIHGHDELNTRRLTMLLQNRFHINPKLIMSEPGMSRPLIDKYEESASSCCFAFALVTPDDEIQLTDNPYQQARPNVIFELGWFVGRLGKHRVAILLKEGTTIHSDLDGVSRIQFRDNIEEKGLEIERELSACGII